MAREIGGQGRLAGARSPINEGPVASEQILSQEPEQAQTRDTRKRVRRDNLLVDEVFFVVFHSSKPLRTAVLKVF